MPDDISAASTLFPWNELAEICKSDSRIRFFVDRSSAHGQDVRQLVDWYEVLAGSNQNRAFEDATALDSYAKFAALAHSNVRATIELEELTARPNLTAVGKFLTTRPVLFLLAVLLVLLLVLPKHAAFAGLIAATAVAPITGLAFRQASTGGKLAYFIYPVIIGGLGGATLAIPLATGYGYSYLSWAFLFAFIAVAWIFGSDHTRKPLIRDTKVILLLPRHYGLERRTYAARQTWLRDALENAVMPELIQTINRLLGPDQEKRLLVQDTQGLRAVYHKDSQVSTRAARRAEDALRRSDGASIALSGPRGCGKSSLLNQLRTADSCFSVLVSAPTQYAPKEFLMELFQEVCTEYISDQGYPLESEGALAQGTSIARALRSRPVQFLRIAIALALTGLLAWSLTGRSATSHVDGMPKGVWADRPVITALVLAALVFAFLPKRHWRNWFRKASEPPLIAQARRYLLRLQAEQTASVQLSGTLPVLQAAFTRVVAQRALPWTTPELVAHLGSFIEQIARTEAVERRRRVMICIDEVDRIGSVDEATKFLSEIKAIFGLPHCYFVVTVAEELGLLLSQRGMNGRSIADSAFDEIIVLEPMSFELCRELLTRRVPGFTEPFVWLSFVLSGGLPRDLIRVARRLAEMTIESDYELRLAEFAERLVREEIDEAAVATRGMIAQLSPGQEWGSALNLLRQRARDLRPETKPVDLLAALQDLAGLPGLLPVPAATGTPGPRDAVVKFSTFALLGLTTCDLFRDSCFDMAGLRDPAAVPPGPFIELAAARRDFAISAEGCRAAVETLRHSLCLDQAKAL